MLVLFVVLLETSLWSSDAFLHATQRHFVRPQQLHVATNSGIVTTEQDHSALELVHKETNCQVVLLGCLHGSASSACNVQRALQHDATKPATSVVVLELCASRFADLRRELNSNNEEDVLFSMPKFMRLAAVVSKTIQKRGFATGMAAAVLGGASGIQTALSGFEPGLEFTTALKSSKELVNCDVILADQSVDETLQRFGKLPNVSFEMFKEYISSGFDWKNTYGREATALQSAIFGHESLIPRQVNMRKFVTQDPAVQGDLIRLTLPPIILVQAVVTLAQAIFQGIGVDNQVLLTPLDQLSLLMDTTSLISSADLFSMASEIMSDVVISAVLLGLGYITMALPAARLILCERDDQLARGVRAACQVAASKQDNEKEMGRVVVVLGLLHINGVAKRLLSETQQ